LTVNGNGAGIVLQSTSGNRLRDSRLDGNTVAGVVLEGAHHNQLDQLEIVGTSGAGIRAAGSDENSITGCLVNLNQCAGISLQDSSRNTVCSNDVRDTASPSADEPAVNLLLYGTSRDNLVCNNQVSATLPGLTADGINVGCKGSCNCGLQAPTSGAAGNLIVGNKADGENRWGIALAPGNPDNRIRPNEAGGNGAGEYAVDP
jgi:parallel beta-helix repeat protein